MSLPITLQSVFAAAPTVTSLSNLSMLLVNSSGTPQKYPAEKIFPFTQLSTHVDVNTITRQGMYMLNGTGDTHGPVGCNTAGALMIVAVRQEGYISQLILPGLWTNGMYHRTMSGNKWESWYRISGVAVQTYQPE